MKSVLVVCILFLSIFCSSCYKPVKVEGSAMNPTLKDGDRVLFDTDFRELKRGDIISFLYPNNKSKWYLKRVIALPGEKIEIIEG